MRKIILLTILIAGSTAGYAEEAAIDGKLEVFTELSVTEKSTQKTAAVKLSSPVVELRTSNRPGKINFGLLMTSKAFLKSFPIEVEVGNLSPGGGLSRLNSPELSAGSSPFTNELITAAPLTVSLPGYSSFSKPQSSFLQLTLLHPQKKPHSLLLNLWVSPENDSPVFSYLLSNKFFSKQLTVSSAVTTGLFNYKENNSRAWFLPSPYYPAGSHLCSLFQLSTDYRQKSGQAGAFLGFTGALYESPFGPFTAVYRADTKASFYNKEVYASFFLNPYEDVLTSSGKKLEPSFQIKTGINSKKAFLLKNSELLMVKPAMNIYSSIQLIKNEHPLRVNAGLQLTTNLTSLSFSVNERATILSEAPNARIREVNISSYSLQIKNSWYLKSLTPGISFSVENKLPDTLKYKIQLNLNSNLKQKLGSSCSLSFSSKNGSLENKKLSTGLNCRLNFKQLIVIGKVSFLTDL